MNKKSNIVLLKNIYLNKVIYTKTRSGVYTISNTTSPIGNKEVFNTTYFYDIYYKKFLGLIHTAL